ncbi:MAG: hypothetical protein ACTHNU_16360 [Gaiellales bacterium]
MSAGRAAMWIIASGIMGAMLIVVAADGVSGLPFEWFGVLAACLLAGVAFVLGFAE